MTDNEIIEEVIEENIDHSELRNRSPVPSYIIRELERLRNPVTGIQNPIYIPIYIPEPKLNENISTGLLTQMTGGDTFYASSPLFLSQN